MGGGYLETEEEPWEEVLVFNAARAAKEGRGGGGGVVKEVRGGGGV